MDLLLSLLAYGLTDSALKNTTVEIECRDTCFASVQTYSEKAYFSFDTNLDVIDLVNKLQAASNGRAKIEVVNPDDIVLATQDLMPNDPK